MRTRAIRLHGKENLRLEEFELRAIKEDEILAKVVSDSICMSSHKAAKQGSYNKRVPENLHKNTIITGHEFSGELIEIGADWQHKYKPGQKFSIQPAIYDEDDSMGVLSAPDYSYEFTGGDATYIIISKDVLVQDCLLVYAGPGFYPASLAEPLSYVIGAMHANYHTTPGKYKHNMDIVDSGNMAILAGAGTMGMAAINYVIHRADRKPKLCVVTDIDQERLGRAASIYTVEEAAQKGIELIYLNTSNLRNPAKKLLNISDETGYNDVFIFAPLTSVIEMGDAILTFDGCLNFFAEPSDPKLSAKMNFYNVHYAYTHLAGKSEGNTDDIIEALEVMNEGLDPAGLISHIGGLNSVINTTFNPSQLPGGKKLIYTDIEMPLIAISDFEEKGKTDPLFAELAEICNRNKGLWSVEAEKYLLLNG